MCRKSPGIPPPWAPPCETHPLHSFCCGEKNFCCLKNKQALIDQLGGSGNCQHGNSKCSQAFILQEGSKESLFKKGGVPRGEGEPWRNASPLLFDLEREIQTEKEREKCRRAQLKMEKELRKLAEKWRKKAEGFPRECRERLLLLGKGALLGEKCCVLGPKKPIERARNEGGVTDRCRCRDKGRDHLVLQKSTSSLLERPSRRLRNNRVVEEKVQAMKTTRDFGTSPHRPRKAPGRSWDEDEVAGETGGERAYELFKVREGGFLKESLSPLPQSFPGTRVQVIDVVERRLSPPSLRGGRGTMPSLPKVTVGVQTSRELPRRRKDGEESGWAERILKEDSATSTEEDVERPGRGHQGGLHPSRTSPKLVACTYLYPLSVQGKQSPDEATLSTLWKRFTTTREGEE